MLGILTVTFLWEAGGKEKEKAQPLRALLRQIFATSTTTKTPITTAVAIDDDMV
jgi:hypothetical protein